MTVFESLNSEPIGRCLLKLSVKLRQIGMLVISIPIAFFMIAQICILFSIPVPDGSMTAAIVKFVDNNTWKLLDDISVYDAIKVLFTWGLINFLIYSFIGILAAFMYLYPEPPPENMTPFDDVMFTVGNAIIDGPAHAKKWIKQDYFDRILAYKERYIAFLYPKERSIALLNTQILLSYVDFKITKSVSNLLSLKIRFLKLVGLFMWGLYPYAKALEDNIVAIGERTDKNC